MNKRTTENLHVLCQMPLAPEAVWSSRQKKKKKAARGRLFLILARVSSRRPPRTNETLERKLRHG